MGYVFFSVILLFAVLMLPFSDAAFNGASDGLKLFAGSVLPSLFPFIVCADYLMGSDLFKKAAAGKKPFSGLSLAALTAVCGTPSSAMIADRLYRDGILDHDRSSFVCAVTNQVGPLFILSTLSSGFLSNRAYALPFFIAHYAPPLLASSFLLGRASSGRLPMKAESKSQGGLPRLALSISNAVTCILRVGGTVVFFKVLFSVSGAAIPVQLIPNTVGGLLAGLAEMTNGLKLLSDEPSRISLSLCAFLLSFGGLSLFVQSKLVFPELSAKLYFIAKLVSGLVSFALFFLILPLFPSAVETFCGLSESLPALKSSFDTRLAALFGSTAAVTLTLISAHLYSRFVSGK